MAEQLAACVWRGAPADIQQVSLPTAVAAVFAAAVAALAAVFAGPQAALKAAVADQRAAIAVDVVC
jgi:hypothetical protein